MEKAKKPIYKRWWFILLAVVILFFALLSSGGETSLTPEEIQVFKESAQSYDYQEIERNPDNFKDKPAVFKGKVVQVSEGSFNITTLRVATQGDYDNIVYVTYTKPENQARILEDDIITIYGVLDGVITYKSIMGQEITIPSIRAKIIETQ